MITHTTIPAADGRPLAASTYDGGDAVLLIAPATGVQRRLYDAFARFAAAHSLTVVTWDWRGTGDSRPRSLRGYDATMLDWGTRDLAGIIDWAAGHRPGARMALLGHSFGGQAPGLAPNADRLSRIALVAAQSGYVGHWPVALRVRYTLLWYLLLPALTHGVGYFPGRRLGVGEDLPRNVALQWARWCRSPRYLGDWRGHRQITAPLLAFSFTDDSYAPPRAVDALLAEYGSAERHHRVIAPSDLGVPRIGHFGFFREGIAPVLWEQVVSWLREGDSR